MIEKRRGPRPQAPGAVLRKMLKDAGITQDDLAVAIGVSRLTVSEIIREKRGVSAKLALLLGRSLDTEAEYWIELQGAVDLHDAAGEIAADLAKVTRLVQPKPIFYTGPKRKRKNGTR